MIRFAHVGRLLTLTSIVAPFAVARGEPILRHRAANVDLTGTLSDSATGGPLQSAEISVTTAAGGIVANTTADAFGRFIIHNLSPGSSRVLRPTALQPLVESVSHGEFWFRRTVLLGRQQEKRELRSAMPSEPPAASTQKSPLGSSGVQTLAPLVVFRGEIIQSDLDGLVSEADSEVMLNREVIGSRRPAAARGLRATPAGTAVYSSA